MTSGAPAYHLGVFDMFTVGIGPSSSHTVGPMRAGRSFAELLSEEGIRPRRIRVRLFGSLAATGVGHGTDRAVLLGLVGEDPRTVSVDTVDHILPHIATAGSLPLFGGGAVPFSADRDLLFEPRVRHDYHVNALTIEAWEEESEPGADPSTFPSLAPHNLPAWDEEDRPSETIPSVALSASGAGNRGGEPIEEGPSALARTYFSTGGGFVLVEGPDGDPLPLPQGVRARIEGEQGKSSSDPRSLRWDASSGTPPSPIPFTSATELMGQCEKRGSSVAEVMRANELSRWRPEELDSYLDLILDTMFSCIQVGCETGGTLPGGLGVPRRALALRQKLEGSFTDPLALLDWVALYALAVNEENAAGHRVVTAPTNGAAGIIPAVLGYFLVSSAVKITGDLPAVANKHALWHLADLLEEFPQLRPRLREFLLTAAGIGSIIKTNASIAGAEVGCQGEVGSASAMAAAGLAQALGGTPQQVENAAEIAMEHSLGLTCDPVGGLVQIPCIERNAVGAVKAISAARMALYGDGRHQVSLDIAIETMRQTGVDMLAKYKETSDGGLAVNVVEC